MKDQENKFEQFDLFKALSWIRDLNAKSGEKAILYALATRMDKKGTCFPGVKRLAKDAGYSNEKSVSRIISILAKKEFVAVQARNKEHSKKQTNIYSFPIFHDIAETVLSVNQLSEDEQTQWAINLIKKFLKNKTVSYKKLAKFWYLLRDEYYPILPKNPLSKYNQKAMQEIVGWCNNDEAELESCTVYSVFYFGVSQWDSLRNKLPKMAAHEFGTKAKLPEHPTPVAFRDNFELICMAFK